MHLLIFILMLLLLVKSVCGIGTVNRGEQWITINRWKKAVWAKLHYQFLLRELFSERIIKTALQMLNANLKLCWALVCHLPQRTHYEFLEVLQSRWENLRRSRDVINVQNRRESAWTGGISVQRMDLNLQTKQKSLSRRNVQRYSWPR